MKAARATVLPALLLLATFLLSQATSGSAAAPEGPYLGAPPPGDRPERFAPEVIATPPGVHSSAIFSPDGATLLWSPMARGSETRMMTMAGNAWSEPAIVDFGMGAGVGEPFFSPDGRRLYFLSFRPSPGDPVERERIWYAERAGDGWSAPRLLDETVAAHPTHWQFSVAANSNLYFTSEAKGVRGGQDIYLARFEVGRYLPPADLGPHVNSDGLDLTPYIAPDESYLLFARSGPATREADLYVSFRADAGGWTPAVPLGDHINTAGNELCPVVSPDGKYLFYTGRVEQGYGVYWVDASFISRLKRDAAR